MAVKTVIVTQVIGKVWILNGKRALHEVLAGMHIPVDAELMTEAGSTVQLRADGQPIVTIGADQTVLLTADLFESVEAVDAAILMPSQEQAHALIVAINAGQDISAELEQRAEILDSGSRTDVSGYVRMNVVLDATHPLSMTSERVDRSCEADGQLVVDADYAFEIPQLTISGPASICEDSVASYEVFLSNALDAETTLNLTLTAQVVAEAVAQPSVYIDGVEQITTQNEDGSYSITIPAGVAGGIVVMAPLVVDGASERPGALILGASLKGEVFGNQLPDGIETSSLSTINNNSGSKVDTASSADINGKNVNENESAAFTVSLRSSSVTPPAMS